MSDTTFPPRLIAPFTSSDFRSSDGLYAAMKDGRLEEEGRVSETPVSDAALHSPTPSLRSRRAAAVQGERLRQRLQETEDTFKIADPQELASIEVFREHPEVF